MSKIHSRLVVKPEIILSLSARKNCSINLLDLSSFVRYLFMRYLILESQDLKGLTIFGQAHPIIIKLTFSFPKFVSGYKKSTR